jgi:hypothetical protein
MRQAIMQRRSTTLFYRRRRGSDSLIPANEEIKIFDSLITLLINRRSLSLPTSLDASCQWYRKYLKNNIINFWPLIRSALNDVDAYSPRPSADELETVVKFIQEIARPLVTEKDLALVEIVDPLVNNKYFKSELIDSDEFRIIPYQLVFAVASWLRKSQKRKVEEGKANLRSSSV